MSPNNVFILDASSILSLQQIFSFIDGEVENNNPINLITTPNIVRELKDDFAKLRIESMMSSNELVTKTADSLDFIESECIKFGNHDRLSIEDKSILSLAWDESRKRPNQNVTIISDDYEIQNTANLLGIRFKSIRTKGISYSAIYKKFCSDCKANLNQKANSCQNCGSVRIKLRKTKKRLNKNLL